MNQKILLPVLLLLSASAFAQSTDTLEKRFQLNFVTPDMPAYKSLGVDRSNLLRPSDIKDFAVMLSPFYSNGKSVIPKNFGLEFAPWKMVSKKWTLADYNENKGKRFLYNSSFSLGTVSDSTVYSSKISIGYRFSLLSASADLVRMAYSKKTDFAQKAMEATALKTDWETYWVTKVVSPEPSAAEKPEYADHHQKELMAWLATVDPVAKSLPGELMILVYRTKRVFGDDFNFAQFKTLSFSDVETVLLNRMIATYKNTNWNASRFDGALAWVGESKDSLATNARFSSFNAWATYAQKMGAKGQLLIGGNLKMPMQQ